MKNSPLVLLSVVLALGCGDNLETPAPVVTFGPPQSLKALSVNQSTIRIQWSASANAADSTFRGYVVQRGNRSDTLGGSQLIYTADSLPAGESAFFVYSLRNDGFRSDAATIRWAPATRFDSVYEVYENVSPVSVRPEAFNVGTSTTDPSALVMDPNDPEVQQTMDLFFNGDSLETRQSLSLWSANLLVGSFNTTFFSTHTDASPSLDFPLSAFPAENTFIQDSITFVDNTIYYVKVVGDPLQVNYARIHVHIKAGTIYPNRIIQVRVSLQRTAGLLYALDTQDHSGLANSLADLILHVFHIQS
jgi:hypothetical protein